jgi:hypothetical protein
MYQLVSMLRAAAILWWPFVGFAIMVGGYWVISDALVVVGFMVAFFGLVGAMRQIARIDVRSKRNVVVADNGDLLINGKVVVKRDGRVMEITRKSKTTTAKDSKAKVKPANIPANYAWDDSTQTWYDPNRVTS